MDVHRVQKEHITLVQVQLAALLVPKGLIRPPTMQFHQQHVSVVNLEHIRLRQEHIHLPCVNNVL